MENPFAPPGAKPAKAEVRPRVQSARSVISMVAAPGAHGRIGRESAKAILRALEDAGLHVTSKPYVKPVEAKRKEAAQPH